MRGIFGKLGIAALAASVKSALGQNIIAVGTTGGTRTSFTDSILLAESTDGGKTFNLPNITGGLKYAGLDSVDCTADLCVGVGQNFTGLTLPLVVEKKNGGNWTVVPISFPVQDGRYYDVSCKASETFDICVGVGSYYSGFDETPMLALVQSVNGNWTIPTIPKVDGELLGVKCVKNSTDIDCFAAGNMLSNSGQMNATILHSKNGGHWNIAYNAADYLGTGFSAIDCTEKTAPPFCVGIGFDTLVESEDGGVTWTQYSTPGLSNNPKVRCPNPETSACVIMGNEIIRTETPVIGQRVNGTWNWISPPLPDNSTSMYEGLDCIDDSKEELCVAVGGNFNGGDSIPLIAQWNGSWSFSSLDMPGVGLNTVSCGIDVDRTKQCIAGGYNSTTGLYAQSSPILIVMRKDGSWGVVPVPGVPSPGQYMASTVFYPDSRADVHSEKATQAEVSLAA
ncbi:MAG: hypothetical protein Q7V63_03780 [Gammaproteobacteria bacterium]|nr:hypothetical protein [Gammaproteobacteria bacterium]